MKNFCLIVLLILCIGNVISAQNYFNVAHNNFRYSFQYPNQNYFYYNSDYAYCNLHLMDSNNLFFCRSEDSFIFNDDSLHIDMNIVKINNSGDSIWVKNYDFAPYGYELILSALECEDNSIIGVGYITDTFSTNLNKIDGLVLKLDKYGNYIWHKRINIAKDDKFLKIKTKDNGHTYNVLGFSDIGDSTANYDIVYLTIDSLGNVIDSIIVGEYDWDFGRDFEYLDDGNILIAGETYSYAVGTFNRTDVYLFKMDIQGNVLWQKRYGYPGWDNTWSNQCLWLDENENAYIAASHEASDGNYNAWLLKTNNNGDTLWSKMFDDGATNFYDDFRSISQAKDGNLIVMGTSENYIGENRSLCKLIKMDVLGNIIWSRKIVKYDSPNSYLYPYNMSVTSTNNILLSGYVINNQIQSNGIFHRNDAWLCKTDSCGFTSGAQPQALLTIDSVKGPNVYISNLSEEYCTAILHTGNGDNLSIYAYSQWTNGTDPTQLQYTYTDTGTYTLTLYTYAGDGIDTFTTQVHISDTTTSIKDVIPAEAGISVSLFPNPTKDYVIIELSSEMLHSVQQDGGGAVLPPLQGGSQSLSAEGMRGVAMHIYTPTGQLVQSFTLNPNLLQQRVFLNDLANGVYFVNFMYNNKPFAYERISVVK